MYYGRDVHRSFIQSMERYNNRVKTLIDSRGLDGDSKQAIRGALEGVLYNPNMQRKDFDSLFRALGATDQTTKDCIALIKLFTGHYGVLAARQMFKQHPEFHKLYQLIYDLLAFIGIADFGDKMRLLVGRSYEPERKDFVKLGITGDRVLFRNDRYLFKVALQPMLAAPHRNHIQTVKWMDSGSPDYCPIEMLYLEKGVLVMPLKVAGPNGKDEYLLRATASEYWDY